MRAVRFDRYGDVDVLYVDEVPRPRPGEGEVVVEMRAAGINPGEARIREGALHERWPATFPSGQGSDLAGVIAETGPGVEDWRPGDEVIAFTHRRASHAELVLVEAANATTRPREVPWEPAGALFVAGTTAYACVRAVQPEDGDTVVVSAAAGGVGCLVVQLAARTGARVLALASERHHRWLAEHGAIPVAYGDGVEERIRTAADGRVDAFVDAFGGGYVELALALGVARERINTIADFAAIGRHGVKGEGTATAATAEVLAELAALVARGELEVPIAATYPLADVREAFRELERRHTLGKIVLVP